MLKEVIWLGDSKDAASEFPENIRVDLGFQLYILQQENNPFEAGR